MPITKIDGGKQIRDASITNVQQNFGIPVNPTDVAIKSWVESVVQGLDIKQSVRVATTGNITLSGVQTIDGISVVAGNRVLVKDQTLGETNGIYDVVAAAAWTRSVDANISSEVTAGLFTFVAEGTVNGNMGWTLITDDPITLGTTVLVFAQFSGAGQVVAGAGLTKTGNTLDVLSANGGVVVNADNIALTLANASLTIVAGGVKITDGTAGQVLVANASGIPVAQTLSGDVASVSGAGAVTLAIGIVRIGNRITRETPAGVIDGTNKVFTLANTPVVGTEELFLNGMLQDVGVGNDYTISTVTITFEVAPISGDKIRANYFK